MEQTEQPTNQVAHYDVTEAAIAELKERYGSMQIAGINDKDGYNAVAKALRDVVAIRNRIVNRRRELKRQIDGQAEKILAGIEPVEEHLKSIKAPIDEALEREKQEKERKLYERFVSRTEELLNIGYVQQGSLYILDRSIIAADTIRTMSDDEWNGTIQAAQKAAADLKAKQEKDEADRLEKEKELETLRNRLAQLESEKIKADPPPPPAEQPVQPKTVVLPNVQPKAVVLPEPPKVETVLATVPEEEAPRLDFERSADFVEGFNIAKTLIAERINNPEPITRKVLIEFINNLKP